MYHYYNTRYFIFFMLAFALMACDASHSPAPKESTEKEENSEVEEEKPTEVLNRYFEAIKKRDHKALQKLLRYPAHKFYLKEPTPITHWQVERIEELTSAEADSILIKPNPIQEDLLITVREFTVDDYKKLSYEAKYILREEKHKWYLVNRIAPKQVAGVFLKFGEYATEFEEYEVKLADGDRYLVAIQPWLWITINEQAKPLDTLKVDTEERLRLQNRNEIWIFKQKKASWDKNGLQLEIPKQDSLQNTLPERDTTD